MEELALPPERVTSILMPLAESVKPQGVSQFYPVLIEKRAFQEAGLLPAGVDEEALSGS